MCGISTRWCCDRFGCSANTVTATIAQAHISSSTLFCTDAQNYWRNPVCCFTLLLCPFPVGAPIPAPQHLARSRFRSPLPLASSSGASACRCRCRFSSLLVSCLLFLVFSALGPFASPPASARISCRRLPLPHLLTSTAGPSHSHICSYLLSTPPASAHIYCRPLPLPPLIISTADPSHLCSYLLPAPTASNHIYCCSLLLLLVSPPNAHRL